MYGQYAQSAPDFPAPYSWNNWTTIYSDNGGSISISFETAPKQNICQGMAYSYFRVQSTYTEKVNFSVSFSYVGCDGNLGNSGGYFDFDQGPGMIQYFGNWFLGYAGPSITNIKVNNIKFPDREALKRRQDSIADAQRQQNQLKRTQDSLWGLHQRHARDSANQAYNVYLNNRKIRQDHINDSLFEQRKAAIDAQHAQFEANSEKYKAAIANGTEGIFHIADLLSDHGGKYPGISSLLSISAGIDVSLLPTYLNSVKVNNVNNVDSSTSASNIAYLNACIGFNYYPIISKKLSINFHGGAKFGIPPAIIPQLVGLGGIADSTSTFTESTVGYFSELSGGAEIQIGPLLSSIDYISRNWNYSDVQNYEDNSSNSLTTIVTGSAHTSTIRYGIGLRFSNRNDKNGNGLMVWDLMALFDNSNYYPSNGNVFSLPVTYRLKFTYDFFTANLEFAPNYPVASIALKPTNNNSSYVSVSTTFSLNMYHKYDIPFSYKNKYFSNERQGEILGYADYLSITDKSTRLPGFMGLGLNLKYKKVIHRTNNQNSFDFQCSTGGIMTTYQNEYRENEEMRVLNISPDVRYTYKLNDKFYVGSITGLSSMTIRNIIPNLQSDVLWDSQHYFLQGSLGVTAGLMYSRKATACLNYYFRPTLIGTGTSAGQVIELELAFKSWYFNLGYASYPDYLVGYVVKRDISTLNYGVGFRMPW